MAARDAALSVAVAWAVYDFDKTLVLFGLSGSHSISEAKALGLKRPVKYLQTVPTRMTEA